MPGDQIDFSPLGHIVSAAIHELPPNPCFGEVVSSSIHVLPPVEEGGFNHGQLALLWQFRFAGVGEAFLTVRASPGWRPCEEVEDSLPDGRHARLWRWSPDSFFSAPLL